MISENAAVLASWANFRGESKESPSSRNAIWKSMPQKIKSFMNKRKDRAFLLDYVLLPKLEPLYFTERDKLLIIVPDCHIPLFKGWITDGFVKPVLKDGKPKSPLGGYFGERESLEGDFADFISHSDADDEMVNIGDLFEVWQLQWMYEWGFRIYDDWEGETSWWKFWKDERRFPKELLARKSAWNPSKNYKCDHSYFSLGDSDSVRLQRWRNKVAPLDIMALMLWGLKLPWFATPLTESEYEAVNDLLFVHLPKVDAGQQNLSEDHKGWAGVDKLRESVCLGKSMPLDFTDNARVERRIRKHYPQLASYFKNKIAEPAKYLRGNHDCKLRNEYLVWRFHLGKSIWWTPDSLEEFVGNDDEPVNLPPEISRLTGYKDKICIEHGDAFDSVNNDRNYFRFDVKGGVLNGGYHTARDLFLGDQLNKPDSNIHKLFTWIGDSGLEAPSEERADAIFRSSKGKDLRLVVMGHTHLPKIIKYPF
jgi:UDP-2,3-diacylglucosamine pyrophosphatase LpxH